MVRRKAIINEAGETVPAPDSELYTEQTTIERPPDAGGRCRHRGPGIRSQSESWWRAIAGSRRGLDCRDADGGTRSRRAVPNTNRFVFVPPVGYGNFLARTDSWTVRGHAAPDVF